jgi:hypothetical protein
MNIKNDQYDRPDPGSILDQGTNYFVRSSVLGGQIITEAEKTGRKAQTYVIAAGTVLARQLVNTPDTSPTQQVAWEHRDSGDTEVKFTDSSGYESSNFTSSRYDPLGRMVGFPEFEVPILPPHRLPSPYNEVPEDMGGGDCQIMVDGLMELCSSVTRDNVQLQVRNGDKVTNFDPNRELPGTTLHFTVTWEETRTNSGWTTEEDENGYEVPVWSDYIGSSTAVHFSNISISSWNLSRSSGRPQSRGTRLSRNQVKKIADDIQEILDANPDCLSFIRGILSNAATPGNPVVSENPIDVIWAIYMQNGFWDVPNLDAGGYAKGAIFRIRTGNVSQNASVELMGRNFNYQPTPDIRISQLSIKEMNRTQELLRALDALNEGIHLSGARGYDDRDMSLATASYLGIDPPDYGFSSNEDVRSWSNWWHPKVGQFCNVTRTLAAERTSRRRAK